MVFHNSARPLTPKLINKNSQIVEWVIEASPDVVIVPVVVQYDRVLEIKNLLTKVSGAKLTQKSFVSVFRS